MAMCVVAVVFAETGGEGASFVRLRNDNSVLARLFRVTSKCTYQWNSTKRNMEAGGFVLLYRIAAAGNLSLTAGT
jgi:hypothetical protein